MDAATAQILNLWGEVRPGNQPALAGGSSGLVRSMRWCAVMSLRAVDCRSKLKAGYVLALTRRRACITVWWRVAVCVRCSLLSRLSATTEPPRETRAFCVMVARWRRRFWVLTGIRCHRGRYSKDLTRFTMMEPTYGAAQVEPLLDEVNYSMSFR